MEALREYGYRIPDDIPIIRINNTVESKYSRPPLTTSACAQVRDGRARLPQAACLNRTHG
jgi:DNA-binding LacI/PurR family transcriptional regulator